MKDSQGNNIRGNKGYTTYYKINNLTLSLLYNRSICTIKRWIANKEIDPTDMISIIKKYNEINKIE